MPMSGTPRQLAAIGLIDQLEFLKHRLESGRSFDFTPILSRGGKAFLRQSTKEKIVAIMCNDIDKMILKLAQRIPD